MHNLHTYMLITYSMLKFGQECHMHHVYTVRGRSHGMPAVECLQCFVHLCGSHPWHTFFTDIHCMHNTVYQGMDYMIYPVCLAHLLMIPGGGGFPPGFPRRRAADASSMTPTNRTKTTRSVGTARKPRIVSLPVDGRDCPMDKSVIIMFRWGWSQQIEGLSDNHYVH